MHGMIFFGFVVLHRTALIAKETYITGLSGMVLPARNLYLVFSFLMDFFGLGVLFGVLLALYRRYVSGPTASAIRASPTTPPTTRSFCCYCLASS